MDATQFVPLVTQVPCNSITKSRLSSLTVRVNYTWQGSSRTVTGYAVVTQSTWWTEFDEIGSTKMYFSAQLPESPNSSTSGYFMVYGLPLSGCSAGSNYGIKIHFDDFGEFGAKNVLTITDGGAGLQISSLSIS